MIEPAPQAAAIGVRALLTDTRVTRVTLDPACGGACAQGMYHPGAGRLFMAMFTTHQRGLVFAAALPGSQAGACVAARRAPVLSLEHRFQDRHINAKAGELS